VSDSFTERDAGSPRDSTGAESIRACFRRIFVGCGAPTSNEETKHMTFTSILTTNILNTHIQSAANGRRSNSNAPRPARFRGLTGSLWPQYATGRAPQPFSRAWIRPVGCQPQGLGPPASAHLNGGQQQPSCRNGFERNWCAQPLVPALPQSGGGVSSAQSPQRADRFMRYGSVCHAPLLLASRSIEGW